LLFLSIEMHVLQRKYLRRAPRSCWPQRVSVEHYARAPGQAAPLMEKIMPRPQLALTRTTLVLAPLLVCTFVVQASKSPARRTTRTPSTLVQLAKTDGVAPRAAPASGELTIVNALGATVGVCPLKNTRIKADVSGFVARVTVEQRFHNPSKEPIEALYTFPLPADAAVDGMTMAIGARRISGRIKKREEARQIYEAAKSAGQAAALLDQERPNIFTQAVANILPGEDVTVQITYNNTLAYDAGRYELSIPTVVGPRYTPSGGYSIPGKRGAPSTSAQLGTKAVVTDAEKITPPIAPPSTRAGHDISIEVNLDAGVPVGEISSVLHPIDVQKMAPSRARIKLRDAATRPNKDFILRFGVAGEHLKTGVIAYAPSGGDGYFSLMLQPPSAPAASEIAPKEMVFVIDQTGSQSGWPIEKAKEAMRFCIARLRPNDTFQLIGFNTQIFPCFDKPVPATAENIARAQKFLEPIQGGGGTDILKSVEYALLLPDDPARARIVCYMTDGFVGNDAQILDYIGKNRGRARMFPFGIGNSVNRFLIDGMAREGRGVAEYVTLAEQGAPAAEKFHERTRDPLLLDVAVDWNGLAVRDVFPRHIPDVFSAAPIILKGRYSKAGEGDIILSGILRGKPWQRKIHVVLPAVQKDGGEAMPAVWAREKMADLEAQDWMATQGQSTKDGVREQMTALALEYRLMSPFTSFVAVEERVVNVGGQQRTLDVPVEMPDGVSYEGIFGTTGDGRAARKRTVVMRGVSAPSFGGVGGGAGFGSGGRATARPSTSAAAPTVALENRVTALESRPVPPARTQISPSVRHRSAGQVLADTNGVRIVQENLDIAQATPEGKKRLAALKPVERLPLLRSAKLESALHNLPARVQKEGKGGSLSKKGAPTVTKNRVAVQIWLNALGRDDMKKLAALGWKLDATLRPGKLLLGSIPVAKLDALIALDFVRRVEMPRWK
jgi:Ca-activated chloride channel family protein